MTDEIVLTATSANAINAALILGMQMLAQVEGNRDVAAKLRSVGLPCNDELVCEQPDTAGSLIAIFAEAMELVRQAAENGREAQ